MHLLSGGQDQDTKHCPIYGRSGRNRDVGRSICLPWGSWGNAYSYISMMPLKILIACEESQRVCLAFRARGHQAYSCDLQECSGGHPEFHLQIDAIEAIKLYKWDLMVAHPPCTYLSCAGQAWKTRKQNVRPDMKEFREAEAAKAIEFIKALWAAPIERIALENPVGLANTRFKPATQIIHPYYFGDGEMKRTCLWLKRLPRLNGLATIDKDRDKPKPTPGKSRIGSDGKLKNEYFVGRVDSGAVKSKESRAKIKSKTFPGIARAMARQWSPDLGYFNTTTFISKYAEL